MTTPPGPGSSDHRQSPKSWPRRHKILTAIGALAAIFIVGSIASAAGSHSSGGQAGYDNTSGGGQPVVADSASPAAQRTSAPAPARAHGKYSGSCNYTLGSNPVGGTAVFVGEIDMTNTGNIGTIVRARITWPQEGYAPITMRRTVRVPFGQTEPVRFHYHASGNQVDLLQAWQTGHNSNDGCTYHAAIIGTYGSSH